MLHAILQQLCPHPAGLTCFNGFLTCALVSWERSATLSSVRCASDSWVASTFEFDSNCDSRMIRSTLLGAALRVATLQYKGWLVNYGIMVCGLVIVW